LKVYIAKDDGAKELFDFIAQKKVEAVTNNIYDDASAAEFVTLIESERS
jgi:hypothetical protein